MRMRKRHVKKWITKLNKSQNYVTYKVYNHGVLIGVARNPGTPIDTIIKK